MGWRDDVPAILASADAFVCASDYEGMSNALLEAMAAGLPVVATDVGDNAMVLRSGADGIVTDRPDLLNEVLDERRHAQG